jgi:hypothetical protein
VGRGPRGDRPRRLRGRGLGARGAISIPLAVLLGVAGVAGVAVGVGAVAAGVGSTNRDAELDAVPFSTCPEWDAVGDFHRGDRVLATARDAHGDWLQVRDPRDLDARVWVRTTFVVPDADVRELPRADCSHVGTAVLTPSAGGAPVVIGGPGPTGAAPTTTVTRPGSPVAAPGATSPPTLAPGGPATEAPTSPAAPPADTSPPTVGSATAAPSTVYDTPCTGQATTALVRVPVSDPSGIKIVTIAWTIGSSSGSATASLVTGQWQASVGPFAHGTQTGKVGLAITAVDAYGNQTVAKASPLSLQACFG